MSTEMTAAVVAVGDELVEGRVPNTNGAWLAQQLGERGYWPRLGLLAADDVGLISGVLALAKGSTDLVVVCGGLGCTPDDVTRHAVAEVLQVGLQHYPSVQHVLERRSLWARGQVAVSASMFPRGAVPIGSPLGGVPGFAISRFIVLPGVPREMRAMFENISLPKATPIRSLTRVWLTTEDRLVAGLDEFKERWPQVRLGSYPDFPAGHPTVTLVLTARDQSVLERADSWITRLFERGGIRRDGNSGV